MTKIERVTASTFRGISAPLTLDFRGTDGKPQSILAWGDNGSGKSSLAESFEFCLRGKVSRRGNAGLKTRREARNLLMPGRAPSVAITLDDGKTYIRGKAQKGSSGIALGRDQFVPGFELCPVVISRDDIEVFWHLSPSNRSRFFFDYLRDSVKHPGYAALEVERGEEQLAHLNAKVLSAQIALSAATSWPVAEIPISRQAFNSWLRRAYPAYQASSDAKSRVSGPRGRGRGPHVTPAIKKAISVLSSAIESEAKLSRHLVAMRGQATAADGMPSVLARDLPGLLGEISSGVTADFLNLAHLDHVKNISLEVDGHDGSLNLKCVLSSGTQAEPTQVLSEGALDLLAILLLLGVAQACAERGQSRFLVLDDVWQSVDTVHRTATLDYLFSRKFRSWQLLVTAHDRLWARLIEARARRSGFKMKTIQFGAWSESDGPIIATGHAATVTQLSMLLRDASPEVLGSYSGRAIEELADELSQTLRASISRASGDRYTLGDLWPSVSSIIRKKFSGDAKAVAHLIDNELDIRNLYSAHYNDWAESFSAKEIRDFAKHIVELWNVTHCTECGAPVSLIDLRAGTYGWSCGHENEI